jgi:flagellar assembly protein FliH
MVETLLSRIIKAQQNPELAPFDFTRIEVIEPPTRARRPPQTDAGRETDRATADPLDELDALIHKQLLEAERKAQEIERDAYEKGYAQGEKDGVEFGRKGMAVMAERLTKLHGELSALPRRILTDYRGWLIDLSLAMARHIVQRELQTDPELILQFINQLVGEAEQKHNLTLYIHPSDLELLEKYTDLRAAIQAPADQIAIKADPRLLRGGCRLESDIQVLDASLDARLALIEERLFRGGIPSQRPAAEF